MSNKKEKLSVMEAVDELSKMAEIDHELSDSELADREMKQEKVVETFKVLHGYLKNLYEKDKEFEDPHTRKGVQAIMGIASEAAQKIDRFTVLFKDVHGGVQELKEFQDLQQFYLRKICKRFEDTLASEEAWEAEWGGQEIDLLDIQRRGLKDLETVRRDKDYELFYIRKEDGRPFFHRNLVRHIRLVGAFDESITDPAGDDPFIRLKRIEDTDLHKTAKAFVSSMKPLLEAFYHDALKYKENPFILNLSKACMALLLAANPRNQMQNTLGKASLRYFFDFHNFLRDALQTEEYTRALEIPLEHLEQAVSIALQLSSRMAGEFFTRKESFFAGADELLLHLFEKSSGHKPLSKEGKNPLWLWNSLLDDDESLRNFFKRYPSGPMLKTLDVLREGEERGGFDPLSQENWPSSLYRFFGGDLDITVLHLPSPVIQTHIDQAVVAPEFRAFLRRLTQKEKKQMLLVFNLQNRTSWQEHARANCLENCQKNAEFAGHLAVITLPMDTEFYSQSVTYENLQEAKLFKDQLFEQVLSGEECGYFIPGQFLGKEFTGFVKACIDSIHQLFFAGKGELIRKNRLDFIEIFYLFLSLYFLAKAHPDYVSFTCKDAIDTGAVMGASLFSLIKVLSKDADWTEEQKTQLLHILYTPALMLRERAVDKSRLHRFVSAMSLVQAELEAQGEKLRKKLNGLFAEPIFDLIQFEKN